MAVPILIVTSSPGFGELIRQTLEDAGGFLPALASRPEDALDHARRTPFALMILDIDLEDPDWRGLVSALRQARPQARCMLVQPAGEQLAGFPEGIAPDGVLSKPFYMPELLESVESTLGPLRPAKPMASRPPASLSGLSPLPGAGAIAPPAEPAPAWMDSPDRAAQHLTRLSLEASSQAALILKGSQMWAYAGQLSQPAAEELARLLAHHWAHNSSKPAGGGDLARFVRLNTTGGEYMLYATHLGGDRVLGLAFDAETPFSKIRTQAVHLARLLAASEESAVHDETVDTSQAWEPVEFDTAGPQLEELPPFLPADSLPPPTPGVQTEAERIAAWQAVEAALGAAPAATLEPDELDLEEEAEENQLPLPPEPAPATKTQPIRVQRAESETALTQDMLAAGQEGALPLEMGATSPAFYYLNYVCVLVPRIPTHHLTGALSARLSEWVRQLCVAFGWRLEHLSIRPDYLLWISTVPPSTSPAAVIKTMRKQTSRRIFYEFPVLSEENPSGDFWAPGYLLVSASPLPTSQALKDFVNATRKRQGISGTG